MADIQDPGRKPSTNRRGDQQRVHGVTQPAAAQRILHRRLHQPIENRPDGLRWWIEDLGTFHCGDHVLEDSHCPAPLPLVLLPLAPGYVFVPLLARGQTAQVIIPQRAHVRTAAQRAALGGSTFTDESWHAMASGAPYADAQCFLGY